MKTVFKPLSELSKQEQETEYAMCIFALGIAKMTDEERASITARKDALGAVLQEAERIERATERATTEAQTKEAIQALMARLPEGYFSSYEISRSTKDGTYSLMIDSTSIFQGVPANEAIERATRYVREREGFPTLPVGVIDGIYD